MVYYIDIKKTILPLLLAILVSLIDHSGVWCATTDESGQAFADIHTDKIVIGNDLVRYTFRLSGNIPELLSVANLANNNEMVFEPGNPLFSIGEATDSCSHLEAKKHIVNPENNRPQALQAELIYTFPNLKLRQLLTILPDCPGLGVEYFLMAKNDHTDFSPEETVSFNVGYKMPHLGYAAVEFSDQTDINNTLVHIDKGLGFTHPRAMKGNILFVEDLVSGTHIWLLKKAPCSNVQLHYPGFDFVVDNKGFSIAGMGITPADLHTDTWIPVYGFAIGPPSGNTTELYKSMRTYQKKIHKSDPALLEMVMMNTWGDRNRDASISAEFIRREIDAAQALGITHFQIDDGWQRGKSMNSANQEGKLWEAWTYEDWQPEPSRFNEGFAPVVEYAEKKGIKLGLWFNPSRTNDYASWETDAGIVSNLFKEFGIRFFKIDGIDIPTKKAEVNLRNFYQKVQEDTGHSVIFNIDATAGRRGGYFYLNEFGNIFLENRYTDWRNYFPYQTLRNLWMLSAYVPPEKLQIEFLNKWRNDDKYDKEDPFRPGNLPFDYLFAITMMAQPLAWFEGSGLPAEAFEIAELVKTYTSVQEDIHSGIILPIGDEPSGTGWTGFQSIKDNHGYFLIFREFNNKDQASIKVHDMEHTNIRLELIAGKGKSFVTTTGPDAFIDFALPEPHSFALYKYIIND